ncbi:MAG: TIGR04255 family protein [Pseudomonadota bacterium]
MAKIKKLPSFENPPINEVVMAIQFTPVEGFNVLHYNDVYSLFEKDFKHHQQKPRLQPTFETFGGNSSDPISIELTSGMELPRMWFVSKKGEKLIQFQDDKFIFNWRKRSMKPTYPRYENLLVEFQNLLEKLSNYFKSNFKSEIEITQIELSYLNIIPLRNLTEIDKWIKLPKIDLEDVESLNVSMARVLQDASGASFARFSTSVATATNRNSGDRAIQLGLSVKGRPSEEMDQLLPIDFFNLAREKIVTTFNDITTSKAHKAWSKHEQ